LPLIVLFALKDSGQKYRKHYQCQNEFEVINAAIIIENFGE
jgi:hypothetical protein